MWIKIRNELFYNIRVYRWFIIGVMLYMLYFAIFHHGEPNCLVKHTIGIPCPTCGMTRALWYAVTFQFSLAFFYHPLFPFVPFLILVVLLQRISPFDKLYTAKWFWMSIIGLFVVVYIIRMTIYFPDIEPMDYYPNSIISTIFH